MSENYFKNTPEESRQGLVKLVVVISVVILLSTCISYIVLFKYGGYDYPYWFDLISIPKIIFALSCIFLYAKHTSNLLEHIAKLRTGICILIMFFVAWLPIINIFFALFLYAKSKNLDTKADL